ncbi:uncharacterized protein LOC144054612 [Vanacampus margaritifer]
MDGCFDQSSEKDLSGLKRKLIGLANDGGGTRGRIQAGHIVANHIQLRRLQSLLVSGITRKMTDQCNSSSLQQQLVRGTISLAAHGMTVPAIFKNIKLGLEARNEDIMAAEKLFLPIPLVENISWATSTFSTPWSPRTLEKKMIAGGAGAYPSWLRAIVHPELVASQSQATPR